MAGFCSKCGTALTDNQICTACGASAAAVAAAPAPNPTPAYVAQPIAAPPVKSGSSALKIILIIVAIVVTLGILGAGALGFVAWRISRAIHINNQNGQVSINTPGGNISANSSDSFTASDLGTDIYPGAKSERGGMRMDLPTGSMVSSAYSTTDSKDQVIAFYKSKFGSEASVIDTSNGAIVSVKRGEQESVMVTINANASQNDGKTRIAIVHTKNKK